MIKEFNLSIPSKTNEDIINFLYVDQNWYFGSDDSILTTNINKADAGFMLDSNNPVLNTYAKVICNMVEKDSFMKFKTIDRIYWNWYHSNSNTFFHNDSLLDSKFSIIYNLHTNDGGTEFKVNDIVKFYQSQESMALLFSSKINHRGISPEKYANRFALNITVSI